MRHPILKQETAMVDDAIHLCNTHSVSCLLVVHLTAKLVVTMN